MATGFAPEHTRERLLQLYAFYHEIARIPDTVSEALIGQMRLAWARDALTDVFAFEPKVRRHDVYEGLAKLKTAPGAPSQGPLEALIEARSVDLGEGVFPSPEERLAYVDLTAVNLMRMASQLCKEDALSDAENEAVTAAGRLWGLVGLITAFAPLTEAGRPPFTEQELAQSGLSEGDLAQGQKDDVVKNVLKTGLLKEARRYRQSLTQSRKVLGAELFPAIGYVVFADRYGSAFEALDDPYRNRVSVSQAERQWRLVWASLTGRL